MGGILNRIEQIAKKEGVTITSMEKQIGASKGVLSRAINNNTDIQSKWIQNIVEIYPRYNPGWLITGKGNMLAIDSSLIYNDEQNRELQAKPSENEKGIPLIPLDAVAGFSNSESTNIMEHECERYVIPNFRGAEFLIQVKGSSMYPKYSSGDIVACKKLPLDTFFQWNKVYVLDTEQGVLIKRIKPAKTKDHVICISDNEKYDPFDLHKKDILSVSIVIGVIRLE